MSPSGYQHQFFGNFKHLYVNQNKKKLSVIYITKPGFSWSDPVFLDLNAIVFKHPSIYGRELGIHPPPQYHWFLFVRPFLVIFGFDFPLPTSSFCAQIWNAAPFHWCPPKHFLSVADFAEWQQSGCRHTQPHFSWTPLRTEINLAVFCQLLAFHVQLWLPLCSSAYLSCCWSTPPHFS